MTADNQGLSVPLRSLPALAFVLTVVGILLGNGMLGADGGVGQAESIAATPTLLKPAGPAFAIWSLIYLLLIGYVVWHLTPAGARSTRARSIVWPAIGTLVLNAVWIGTVQLVGSAWGSAVVILALLGCLILVHRRLAARPAASAIEKLLLDVTFGVYLGWVNVATLANLTFAAVLTFPQASPGVSVVLAVVVLAAALGVAWFVLPRVAEPISVALAMTWGLAWIAVERSLAEPHSLLVQSTAVAVALGVLGLLGRTLQLRHRNLGRRSVPAAA